MLVLPPGYLSALKEHCAKREMLMIVDKAQTAIGEAGLRCSIAEAEQ